MANGANCAVFESFQEFSPQLPSWEQLLSTVLLCSALNILYHLFLQNTFSRYGSKTWFAFVQIAPSRSPNPRMRLSFSDCALNRLVVPSVLSLAILFHTHCTFQKHSLVFFVTSFQGLGSFEQLGSSFGQMIRTRNKLRLKLS